MKIGNFSFIASSTIDHKDIMLVVVPDFNNSMKMSIEELDKLITYLKGVRDGFGGNTSIRAHDKAFINAK